MLFAPGKHLQISVMFLNKERAYPSEVPTRCFTLGWAPGLTHKH
jgi:hypothetical protein